MKINARERARLLKVIGQFSGQRVVVLGDLVADEYVHGEITRVSREAPVLILKQREKRVVPGGGANAANNLVDLGAQLILVGAVGEDEAGERLLACFRDKGVATESVLRRPDYPTPTKSRILGVLGHGRPQQIVRVDREPARPLDAEARRGLTASAIDHLDGASALLVSDYGYGAAGSREVRQMRRQFGRRRVLTVDSRHRLRMYTQVTASTPNEPEIEEAFGCRIGSNLALLHALAKRILERQWLDALLVTRGRDGMVLYERRRPPHELPIFGSDQVADVTGAGDTVIAAFTLALAAGATFVEAAMLANCAGGLVVMKSGTASVTGAELAEAIRNA